MKTFSKKMALSVIAVLSSITIQSQISGTFSVPATYSTIASAINVLNTQGVSGPVTILVSSGYTETAPAGGYTFTATGTLANPIVFQKNGAGPNPLITAAAPLTAATPSSAVQNGVWAFVGSDYITIDGIDIMDPNLSNPSSMEYGYGFFKANATNGCQYNVIKNCAISLNALNNDAGAGPATDGSRGIDVVNATRTAHTTSLTITSPLGSNSYNKFYSNTIKNCNTCISLSGYYGSSPFSNCDMGNEIGGTALLSGNTFINYGGGTGLFFGGPFVFPAMAVYTSAQYNVLISNNYINSNNGSGLFHSGVIKGIYLNTANGANATVTSNTLAFNTGTASYQINAIENVSGGTGTTNTISITSNLISGGTSSNVSIYNGITNTAGCGFLDISGNTFTNNIINLPSITSSNFLNYISSTGAVTQSHNVTGNVFTYTGTTYFGPGNGINGITVNGASTCSISVSGNQFANFNFFYPINSGNVNFISANGNCANITVNNNNWSNLTLNNYGSYTFISNSAVIQNSSIVTGNIINGINFTGGTPNGLSLFYRPGSVSATNPTFTYSNNLVSNITSTTSGGSPGLLTFNTFLDLSGTTSPYPLKTIQSNTISNINISSPGDFYGFYLSGLGNSTALSGSSINNNIIDNVSFGGNVYGIYTGTISSPNYPVKLYSNIIDNLNSTGSGTTISAAYLASGGAGLNFYKNKIYNIAGNGTSAQTYGIYSSSASTINIYNNLVGNITSPSSGGNAVNGIYLTGSGSYVDLQYNSVFLNASSTGSNFGSNALYASTTLSLNSRNNIFINNSSSTGSGITVAYGRSSNSFSLFNSASNNNLYYAGTPSSNKLIYFDGTNSSQTLSAYKTLVSPRDGAAVTENVNFQTTSGASANFLNVNTAVPTLVESGATPTSINDDYAGIIRNVTTPDIGAWEGNFLSTLDNTPPSLISSGFTTSACLTSGRTFTANLSDVSGVAAGATAPRVYYKVNNGAYANVAGTLTSGNAMNGVWTFNLTYSGASLDVISWFIVAQDIAGTPNVFGTPAAGLAATSVTNVTTPPTTPNTYTISSLGGIYTVGSAGTFTSLSQAASIYNTSCLTGAVTFSLIDVSYSTNENFPITLLNNTYASVTNSLLIVPAAGLTSSVIGTSTSVATIKFSDASYIRMSGLNAGSSLDIISSSSTTNAVVWLASTNGIGSGNKNIMIDYLGINSVSGNSGAYGIVASADGVNPQLNNGADNDYISIQNNTITTVFYGLYAKGTSSLSTGGINNWNISGNLFGPITQGPSSIGEQGIHIENGNGITISSNTIQNIESASTATICGINIGTGVSSTTINLNNIHSVSYTGTTGWGATGVIIDPAISSANIDFVNNMISDIKGTGGFGFNAAGCVVGLSIGTSAATDNIRVLNNSIALNQAGANAGISSAFFATNSAALFAGNGLNNIDLRNNILYNDISYSSITLANAYAVFSSSSGSPFSIIDYNDYSVSGPQAVLANVGGTQQPTLPMFQTAIGQNANSQTIAPVFLSATDLHLNTTANFLLDNLGTPLISVTTDIDGQARSLTTPDIGADEFTTSPCTSVNNAVVSTSLTTFCNGLTTSFTASGASTGPGISYQWQVSTTAGGPYTNVSGGVGATALAYTTAVLTPAVYYYILETTCATNSSVTASNELTVTVNAIPTASANSNSPVCSGSMLNLNGSSDIATSYSWTGPAGFTSTLQNPGTTNAAINMSGTYTLITTAGSCSSPPATVNIVVNTTPTLNLSVNTATICSGSSFSSTASGASTYSWSNGVTTSSLLVTPTVTTIYSVTGTSSGCNDTQTLNVSVNTTPTLNLSVISGTICSGAVFTTTASGASTYSWSNGTTTSSLSVSPITSTIYTLTGDNSGCTDVKTITITVNALPVVALTSSTGTVCINGSSVSLNGSPAGGTYSGANVSGNVFTPPSVAGIFNPVYTFTDAVTGCANSASTTITVDLCTGIKQTFGSDNLLIYPNPNNGIFEATFGTSEKREIKLSDISGKIIYNETTDRNKFQIDIMDYPAGVYLFKITSKGAVKVVKIIKE